MTKTQTSPHFQEEHYPWRVLIVEDDESNAEVLQLLLGSEIPCQAFSFGDPDAVLQALEEIKALAPDLFIIDYSLPQMTGVQLYQKLHQSDGLEQVSGMILTAHFLIEEQKEELEQLDLELMPKPFELEAFLAVVRRMLAGKKEALVKDMP